MEQKNPNILFMSTYPPRECGIATFTQDLSTATNKFPEINFKIIAMNRLELGKYNYPEEVLFEINESEIRDYEQLAKRINAFNSIKLISIQHEFGIFGGKYLNFLAGFLEKIKKPVVITFHSVVPDPPENIKSLIQYLGKKATYIVVMANIAVNILKNDYQIDESKIKVIPHGIHEVEYEKSTVQKEILGYKNKIILSSFGLIQGGKEYETIIKALPEIMKKFPDILYLMIGATHPGVKAKEGEKYRDSLQNLINELNLQEHAKFVNKYLELDELLQYLKATDIFIYSGKGLTQITSGTLSYAMGCGRPIISHPFLHAKEIVNQERGILVEHRNTDSYKQAILKLLSNKELTEKMGENAYNFTRPMVWNNVANSYVNIFKEFL